jgi:tRNA (guanine-N7-)-methyltransferase
MDWSSHYPHYVDPAAQESSGGPRKLTKEVEIADIGCGFGGLLIALSTFYPNTLILGMPTSCLVIRLSKMKYAGMELRTQVLDYLASRILALRANPTPYTPACQFLTAPPLPLNPYQNISAIRSNTMKFLPNYFHRSQLSKIFLCFPDPHFKARKHKARIVSPTLNAEYAYAVRPGGVVYVITDVEELFEWMRDCFEGERGGDGVQLWDAVSEKEKEEDFCVKIMMDETEEGKKVTRNGGKKFVGVWRRKEDPAWPGEEGG